ncbi:unnamed protein product [Rotaria magnacalcarata]|uniref:Polycystin cation channel PKD1/PKD2 domain-containing protein n=2 Tax=Rotaria magnacalcarata TaxID=392030 RepID=A0A8S2SWH1_9BILA|nr:unnamed protein product [Rotaria magnacalcarata]
MENNVHYLTLSATWSSINTKSDPLSAIYRTYKGGGYVVSLGRTYEKARSVLEELHSQNWLDQLTRAVIIDFSLYNANVNLFVAVTLSFEMTSMGSVLQDYRIKVFRLYDHIGELVNFNAIGSFDEVYSYIVALITFFTMLKFLKLLRFNRRIGMLSKSFSYAQQDLISFGFVFLIFMLAFAQMGFVIFGRSLHSFKNLFNSLTTCFRMLLGEINAPAMIAVSRIYGAFFYLSFVILVFIALLSIFITILNDSFARVKRDLIAKKYRNEMMDFMCSAFRKIVGLNNEKKSKNENDNENEKIPVNSMNETKKAPLATTDDEEI